MKPQKFSKKINIIVVVLVLLVGIALGGYLVLKSKTGQADLLKEMAQSLGDQETVDDFDLDGLKDWEEKIYNTNPINPDTDKDGYLDGEEVAAGYDPTKPAPNDKLAGQPTPTKRKRPEPGNLTQILIYLLANQVKSGQFPLLPPSGNLDSLGALGETLEAAVDEKVIEALQKSSTHFIAEFRPDFADQIKTTEESGLAAIQNYAGEAARRMGKIDSCLGCDNKVLKPDYEVIRECMETQNYEQANCLANSYLQGYQELLKVPVPLDWLDIHKKLLSVFWRYHKIYTYLPEFYQDPLKGIIVIGEYEKVSQDSINVDQEMKADLDSRQ